ncbi:MAG: hypothetical protein ABGX33_02675 [Cycloclasticus sp.]
MALQKVFVIDDDKNRYTQISTVLSFLDYKVKSLTIDKLQNTVGKGDSPLVVLSEGASFKEDDVHAFFAKHKNQQPFLYIHNKGKAPKISKTLANYLIPLEWPTTYQEFVNGIRRLQSAENSLRNPNNKK